MPELPKGVTIHVGDCMDILPTLPDTCAHCCVTSPPYWGLRDYGHDRQLGLEPTPEEYVAKLVALFREVRRVLRDDGVVWLNLGDSYSGSGCGGLSKGTSTLKEGLETQNQAKAGQRACPTRGSRASARRDRLETPRLAGVAGLKPKDLVGIPWRVAFALQADGWWLRQDIIWHKPNPMPESVTDRCTKAHEYIFLLSKSARYFYDVDAIKEPLSSVPASWGRHSKKDPCAVAVSPRPMFGADRGGRDGTEWGNGQTRNRRSVWTVATTPFPESHFATFPEKLIEPCILAGCPVGGIVLDPFAGAGTTGVVAVKHDRRAVLCELNQEYVDMATKRIARAALSPQQMELKDA